MEVELPAAGTENPDRTAQGVIAGGPILATSLRSVGSEGDVGGEENEREIGEREARFVSYLCSERFDRLGSREASTRAAELEEFLGEEIAKRLARAANSRIEQRLFEVTDVFDQL